MHFIITILCLRWLRYISAPVRQIRHTSTQNNDIKMATLLYHKFRENIQINQSMPRRKESSIFLTGKVSVSVRNS